MEVLELDINNETYDQRKITIIEQPNPSNAVGHNRNTYGMFEVDMSKEEERDIDIINQTTVYLISASSDKVLHNALLSKCIYKRKKSHNVFGYRLSFVNKGVLAEICHRNKIEVPESYKIRFHHPLFAFETSQFTLDARKKSNPGSNDDVGMESDE